MTHTKILRFKLARVLEELATETHTRGRVFAERYPREGISEDELRMLERNIAQALDELTPPLSARAKKAAKKARDAAQRKAAETRKANGRRGWSEADIDELVELFPHHTNKQLAEKIGRTASSIGARACILGLKKSRETLARAGRKGNMAADRTPAAEGGEPRTWNPGDPSCD